MLIPVVEDEDLVGVIQLGNLRSQYPVATYDERGVGQP